MNLEEEDAEEAEVALSNQKPWSVRHMGKKDICQKNVLNPNVSYVIKRDIPHSSALGNQ